MTNQTKNSFPVAIYARVSTCRQDSENQIKEFREFVSRSGWAVYFPFFQFHVIGDMHGIIMDPFKDLLRRIPASAGQIPEQILRLKGWWQFATALDLAI